MGANVVDPMSALVSLQAAIRSGDVTFTRGYLHPQIGVYLDHPRGRARFTYAIVANGVVVGIALLAAVDPIRGAPCFQMGYAVIERMRGKGVATKLAQQALDELQNGLSRNGVGEYYIEAVVSASNEASKRVAKKLFASAPTSIKDGYSGEDALQYQKKVVCAA